MDKHSYRLDCAPLLDMQQGGDDTASLGGGLLKLISKVRVVGYLDGITGHVPVSKPSFQDGGSDLEREGGPRLLDQDTVRMKKYLSGFQTRFLKGNGKMNNCRTKTTIFHWNDGDLSLASVIRLNSKFHVFSDCRFFFAGGG